MSELLLSLAEFLLTPAFRWIIFLLRVVLSILLYINEPQRFSYVKSFDGLSYKWHLYIIAMFSAIALFLTMIGMWIQIPFTKSLPEYWYIPVFILYITIITQITIDSPRSAASNFLRLYYTVTIRLVNNFPQNVNVKSINLEATSKGTEIGNLTSTAQFIVPGMSTKTIVQITILNALTRR